MKAANGFQQLVHSAMWLQVSNVSLATEDSWDVHTACLQQHGSSLQAHKPASSQWLTTKACSA